MLRLGDLIRQLQDIAAKHGDNLPVYATAMGETYNPGNPEMAYRYELEKDANSYMTPFEASVYGTSPDGQEILEDYSDAVFKEKCVLVAGR